MAKRDKTKDLFYNAIDYIVMTVIIIGIVTILGWRFELLFNKGKVDTDKKIAKTKEVNVKEADLNTKPINEINEIDLKNNENNTKNTTENTEKKPNKDGENVDTDENNINPNPPTEENKQPETNPNTPDAGTTITVTIPSGTLPKGIGDILANAGLIESSDSFVNRLVELKLDTKLKSGEFKIKSGSSIDQVIQILTK